MSKENRKPHVSQERFLVEYNRANSPAEAAAALNMELNSLNVRASGLRKKGLLTKRFPQGRKKGQKNEQVATTTEG